MKQTLIGLSIAALFSSGMAHAVYTPTVTTTGNNFTMTKADGSGVTGGTNDVTFTWDGTYRTAAAVVDGTYNATLSSPSPFSGKIWTAHNVNLYGPGDYFFDTSCAAGNPSCGTGTAAQIYHMIVAPGQIGAHMLFDWGTNANIDVVNVWDMNKSWAATAGVLWPTAVMQQGSTTIAPANTATTQTLNPLHTVRTTTTTYGSGTATPGLVFTETQAVSGYNSVTNPLGTLTGSPTSDTMTAGGCTVAGTNTALMPNSCLSNTSAIVWSGVSIDTGMDPDFYPGTKMVDGPFVGQSGNFNVMGVIADPSGWFSFPPKTGVTANSTITSDPITVGSAGAISIAGTAGGKYKINSGSYVNTVGAVSVNDVVTIQHTSNAASLGLATSSLTIAGVTKVFTTTTFQVDTTPDQFSFANQTGVTLNSVIVSDTVNIVGINSPTPISITGGEYSINGAAYTSASGTLASNNLPVTVRHTSANSNVATVNTVLNIGGVTATFSSTTKSANAIPFTAAFTMLDTAGSNVGRDTSVTGTYDDTNINTSSTGTKFNMTLQSAVPFFGSPWVAHDIRVFGPGTYTVNTACTVAELRSNGGATCASSGPALTFTVNAGQLGAHILFDWNNNNDIDVAQVWNTDSSPSAVPASAGIVYAFSSQDGNGDGMAGFPMVAGPFIGFNANFDIKFGNYTELTSTREGYPISNWAEVTSDSLASGMLANFTAGNGGATFDILLPPGILTATIVLHAPNMKANDKAYWVDQHGVYHDMTGWPGTVYNYTAKTVTYVVTDNGLGDADGSLNGSISDPVILLSPVSQLGSSTAGGGGGGGCTVDPSGKDASLLAALLASLGYAGWRRRRS